MYSHSVTNLITNLNQLYSYKNISCQTIISTKVHLLPSDILNAQRRAKKLS